MLRSRAILAPFVALVVPASAVASSTGGAADAGTTRTAAVTRAPSLESSSCARSTASAPRAGWGS